MYEEKPTTGKVKYGFSWHFTIFYRTWTVTSKVSQNFVLATKITGNSGVNYRFGFEPPRFSMNFFPMVVTLLLAGSICAGLTFLTVCVIDRQPGLLFISQQPKFHDFFVDLFYPGRFLRTFLLRYSKACKLHRQAWKTMPKRTTPIQTILSSLG